MAILIRGGKANWKLLTLKFQLHGKWIENQGNPTLSKFEISLKTFVKTVKEIGIGYWIELRSTKEQVESYKQEIDKEINELLQEFPKLFEIPNTVPLQRHARVIMQSNLSKVQKPKIYGLIVVLAIERIRWRK